MTFKSVKTIRIIIFAYEKFEEYVSSINLLYC